MPEKCYFESYLRKVLSSFCALIISIKPIDVLRSTWYHLCHFEVVLVILQVFENFKQQA